MLSKRPVLCTMGKCQPIRRQPQGNTAMTSESHNIANSVSRAAMQLETAQTELDRTINRQNTLRKEIDGLVKQMLPDLKSLSQRKLPGLPGNLWALNNKLTALQRSLKKVQNEYTAARQTYQSAVDANVYVTRLQTTHMVQMQSDIDMYTRSQGALSRAFDLVQTRLKQVQLDSVSDDEYQVPTGSYQYIPIEVPRLLRLLTHVDRHLTLDSNYLSDTGRYRPVSFLEVGCGPGRNIMLVQASELLVCHDAKGFDIDEGQVELGKKAFGLEDELFVADATTFDYGAYDVVFTYRPLSDNKKQAALEAHMAATMRPGAYLIAPFPLDISRYPEMSPMGGGVEIWRKQM